MLNIQKFYLNRCLKIKIQLFIHISDYEKYIKVC